MWTPELLSAGPHHGPHSYSNSLCSERDNIQLGTLRPLGSQDVVQPVEPALLGER